MSKNFVVVEKFPNECVRVFNVKAKVIESGYKQFSCIEELDGNLIEDRCTKLVRSILELDGVADVSLSKFEVRVVIGKAFDWEEDNIERDIISNIESILGNQE